MFILAEKTFFGITVTLKLYVTVIDGGDFIIRVIFCVFVEVVLGEQKFSVNYLSKLAEIA